MKKVILVIAAHPDDPDFGAGGTVTKYIQEGAKAYYVICTDGNRGSRGHQVENKELVRKRRQEQENAAKIVGVTKTYFLNHEDGNLMADINLKEELVKIIRELKPDLVFTHDPSWYYRTFSFKNDSSQASLINHHDHRATGIAALDVVYPLSRDLASFPEHQKLGLAPHKVPEIFLFGFWEGANYFEDISKTFETKLKAILAHQSQIDDPKQTRTWLEKRLGDFGKKIHVKYAEGFTRLILR